jgi:hypothetical protein
MSRKACVVAAALLLFVAAQRTEASPITIDGITFPDGVASFADAVVSYTPGVDVGAPYDNPNNALGVPDYVDPNGATSLGEGGTLILQFVDNFLTASGNATPDLHVFEVGGATEAFNLSISTDGAVYIDLGNVSGQPTSVDIDANPNVVFGTAYHFVKLVDVGPGQSQFPFGEADIDAVGAISSVSVPEPGLVGLLGLGAAAVAARRRRIRP